MNMENTLNSTDPIQWLFLGDSITHGAYHTFGQRDFSELFRERIRWELRRQNDAILNMAYSGHTTRNVLSDLQRIPDIYKPGITFLMIGTNDSVKGISVGEYRQNLQIIIDTLQKLSSKVILLTPVFPDGNSLYGKNIPPYVQALREMAQLNQLDLIDIYQCGADNPKHIYHLSDQTHPNAEGHRMIAFEIFKFLDIFNPENSDVCRLFLP